MATNSEKVEYTTLADLEDIMVLMEVHNILDLEWGDLKLSRMAKIQTADLDDADVGVTDDDVMSNPYKGL